MNNIYKITCAKKKLAYQPRIMRSVVFAALATLVVGCNQSLDRQDGNNPSVQKDTAESQLNAIWPVLDIAVKKDNKIESKIDEIIGKMTLEQKVAQMIQPDIRDITVEDMRRYGFGSFLNGGGSFPNSNKHSTPNDWIEVAEQMYQASVDASLDGSSIPTMWGTDAVHGHNNVIGATLFPHNIGLGAANNPELIENIAKITAKEVMVTGIDWVFAPTVAVVRDDRWGRTYEGYSEDADIVKRYSTAIVEGLQGAANDDFLGDKRVISTVKHFLGDGGTVNGDDQGDNIDSEQQLFDNHAQGYIGGLSAGAQSVMASFNSWHGAKNHGSKYLLTDVLKERMGFDGFVVGDWNGHGQVKGCNNESCAQAVNAGLDIFMVSSNAWQPLYENTIAQVNKGEIAISRIDDAVRRILRVKLRAGLFEKPSPANRTLSGKTELIGAQSHRDVARQAVRESLVLLKNNAQLLPLSPKQRVLVAGDGANNIGKQAGGWTLSWQGTGNQNTDFPGASSIYDGIAKIVNKAGGDVELSENGAFEQKPDVAIVVFGEEPYAEGHGDISNLEYQRGNKKDLALLKRLKAQNIPVVSIFISGRPLWVNPELNASDAFVAAWLPGSEGGGIAQVIFTNEQNQINHDFVGKLSYSWPSGNQQYAVNRGDEDYQPLLPYGFGLSYGQKSTLSNRLDETSQKSDDGLAVLTIHRGAAQKPWDGKIYSGKQEVFITSSYQSLPGILYKTTDKEVQEDAFTLGFDGSEPAKYSLVSDFPEDFRDHFEAQGSLMFSYRVDQKPAMKATLTMSCESVGESLCGATLDITDRLNSAEVGQWHSHSIDLQCFSQAGVDIAKVTSPFTIETEGTLQLSLANITIVPKNANMAQQRCH